MLSHIWVKSESNLDQISTRSLTSSNQSWYACNSIKYKLKINWVKKMSLMIFLCLFSLIFDVYHQMLKADNKIHLYMMLTTNLLILFCIQIKVRRIKKFQFNVIWIMLKCCVSKKVNHAEFSFMQQHSF